MSQTEQGSLPQRLELDPQAEQLLADRSVVRDLDRAGHPHFLVKVPDLEKTLQAEVGVELERDEDGSVSMSLLVYDIPTEPVSYDLRFYPDQPEDLRFLWRFIDAAGFRLHPCQKGAEGWEVGPPQTFQLPGNALLRLKHFSLDWPRLNEPDGAEAPSAKPQEALSSRPNRSPDPRDTVIRKLKEQVQALRAQLQERDKRIIELEDELNDIRSKGRSYRLSREDKPWWKPF